MRAFYAVNEGGNISFENFDNLNKTIAKYVEKQNAESALEEKIDSKNLGVVDWTNNNNTYEKTQLTHFSKGNKDPPILDYNWEGLAESFQECTDLCNSTTGCVGFQYRNGGCNTLFSRPLTENDNQYVPAWLDPTLPKDEYRTNKINLEASHGYQVYQKECPALSTFESRNEDGSLKCIMNVNGIKERYKNLDETIKKELEHAEKGLYKSDTDHGMCCATESGNVNKRYFCFPRGSYDIGDWNISNDTNGESCSGGMAMKKYKHESNSSARYHEPANLEKAGGFIRIGTTIDDLQTLNIIANVEENDKLSVKTTFKDF